MHSHIHDHEYISHFTVPILNRSLYDVLYLTIFLTFRWTSHFYITASNRVNCKLKVFSEAANMNVNVANKDIIQQTWQ